VTAVQSE
jgi:aryl-alcohol dehydrogenase-like predicted oxidoreductase